MRTLLVDNYDSFTHNLFHLLAQVTGQEPVVIHNDEPGWELTQLAEFDQVVLSPGPGTPGRPGDFGICREIIDQGGLPLLGICLGHQGIGLAHGATVGRAPEPRHGRVSPVLHERRGLFAGLPSPFEVVRYHSLAVTDLPPELDVTAWTPDGLVMGLRHRERPLWGVQFHPESIGTSYGHELLGNFAELSRQWRSGAPAGDSTTLRTVPFAIVPDSAPASPRRLRVLVEQLPTRWDDEVAYDRLFRGGDHAFWLDSSNRDSQGRYSIMGDASGPLARVARADVASGTVTLRTADGEQAFAGEFLRWLEQDLASLATELPELPFGFTLGWVGYLGYELKAECGAEPTHRAEEPAAVMVFADRALVFDHQEGTTFLLALAEDGNERAACAWFTDTQRLLASIAGLPAGPAPGTQRVAELRLRHDREAYLRLIAECQEEIAAGESYEICLTNMAEAHGDIDPWLGYRFLRRASRAPFGALLQFGDVSVLSTSPERFLRVTRDGVVQSKPIKGTRPRGTTAQEDTELVADLLTNEKDRAENLMIVDLVRNDLGRCAEIGSVEVPELFNVETYATVHQLVSTVTARLRPDSSALSFVRAAFPGGSMTGAPKVRTLQIIDRLEAGARGVYSGAIGYVSLSGAADLSIAIRTAVVSPGRVRYGIGGAIVALSDAAAEFEETAVKAAPLLALTGLEFPGRKAVV